MKNDLNAKNKLKQQEIKLKKEIETYDKLIIKYQNKLIQQEKEQDEELEEDKSNPNNIIDKDQVKIHEQIVIDRNESKTNEEFKEEKVEEDEEVVEAKEITHVTNVAVSSATIDTDDDALSILSSGSLRQLSNTNEQQTQLITDDDFEKIIHEADKNFQLNIQKQLNHEIKEIVVKEQEQSVDELEKRKDNEPIINKTLTGIIIPTLDLESKPQISPKSLTLVKQNINETLFSIKSVDITKESINLFVNLCIDDIYWVLIEHNLTLLNLDPPNLIRQFKFNKNNDNNNEVDIFKEMLFHLIGQLLNDLYLDKYSTTTNSTTIDRQFFKKYLKGPLNKSKAKELIKFKLNDILYTFIDLNNLSNNTNLNYNSKWKLNKYKQENGQQQQIDLIDYLLEMEMRQQEHIWCNYDLELNEAKLSLCDNLFDYLLKDTLNVLKNNLSCF